MSAYGGERSEAWGEGTEHSWWVHSAGPNVGHQCWVGCGPIHRDADPSPGDECARCGVECGRLWSATSVCEG